MRLLQNSNTRLDQRPGNRGNDKRRIRLSHHLEKPHRLHQRPGYRKHQAKRRNRGLIINRCPTRRVGTAHHSRALAVSTSYLRVLPAIHETASPLTFPPHKKGCHAQTCLGVCPDAENRLLSNWPLMAMRFFNSLKITIFAFLCPHSSPNAHLCLSSPRARDA